MFELIPNWHPVFVHFTIALFATSAALYIVAAIAAERSWASTARLVARWNLWIGAVITLGTVALGFYAYNTVAHDAPSHVAMTEHRNWAIVTATTFILLAIWSFRSHGKGASMGPAFLGALVVAAIMLSVTGFKGGEAVYRFGLGVMSLPEAEGEGHDHSHAPGEGHDAPAATADESATHEHEEGPSTHDDTGAAGHEHGPEADSEEHDHEMPDVNASTEEHSHEGNTAGEPHDHAQSILADVSGGGPGATLTAFHGALSGGDKTAALQLLDEKVVIFESGGVEGSREEYASHHMNSDMAFLKNMTQTILSQEIREYGDSAMIITRTRTTGTFRDQQIDSTGTETAILERSDERWKIVHLHWSSS